MTNAEEKRGCLPSNKPKTLSIAATVVSCCEEKIEAHFWQFIINVLLSKESFYLLGCSWEMLCPPCHSIPYQPMHLGN